MKTSSWREVAPGANVFHPPPHLLSLTLQRRYQIHRSKDKTVIIELFYMIIMLTSVYSALAISSPQSLAFLDKPQNAEASNS